MAECDFCLTASEQAGQCKVCLTTRTGPEPVDCRRELAWSREPVYFPRECFIQGMTDAEAQGRTFTVTTALFDDETAGFDEFGNLTFTPSANQKPQDCGKSSRVLQVRADDGQPEPTNSRRARLP